MKLKRWDASEVIFEMECSSWEELLKGALKAKVSFFRADFSSANFRYANFRSADFRYANFSYANFRSADFRYANFSYADFSSADFRSADFSSADFSFLVGNMREWKSMQIDTYMICFNKKILCIGCEQHNIEEWKNFKDSEIKLMDGNALIWWKKWKDFIFRAIELSYEKKL